MNHTYTIFKKIRIKIRRIVRLAKILQEEEKEKIPNVTQHCKHRGWLTPRGMGGIYEKNETSLSLSTNKSGKEGETSEREKKGKNRDHFRLEADPTDKAWSRTEQQSSLLFHVGRAKRRVRCDPTRGRLASLQL